jgi:hypothetical protein
VSSPLAPLPDDFTATVSALHRVAEEAVAPARKPDNEISLRATPGGFGTPEFEWEGATHQVRVEGAELVREVDGVAERTPLEVDAAASHALGELYRFGAEVLGELVARAAPQDAATIPRLWPEHFDIAIELGPEERGLRANYGLSPGDEGHAEPYLYVGPWRAEVSGELWNAQGFGGAELAYANLIAAEDQTAAALDFFATRWEALKEIAPPTEEEQ